MDGTPARFRKFDDEWVLWHPTEPTAGTAVAVQRRDGTTSTLWVGERMMLTCEDGGFITDFTDTPPKPPLPPLPPGSNRCHYCGEVYRAADLFTPHGCDAEKKEQALIRAAVNTPLGDGVRTCLGCGDALDNGELLDRDLAGYHFDCA